MKNREYTQRPKDIQAIMNGMQEKNRLLSDKVDEMVILSEKLAEVEKDWKIALASTMLRLKADGQPVTLIKSIAEGDKVVADLRMKYLVAEGVYKACRERIKSLDKAIETYRSILAWNKAEYLQQQ